MPKVLSTILPPSWLRTKRAQNAGRLRDHETLKDVLEYVAAVVIAIVVVLMLSDELTTPLWGGLTDAHFR